jgi:cytochrome c oxidase subunit 2
MDRKDHLLRAVLVGVVLLLPGPLAAEERGPELFQLCAQCHGPAGGGNHLFLAPAIAGLPEWYVSAQLHAFRAGLRGIHPDDVGGLRMYPMSLAIRSDEDLDTLAAYVSSLPRQRPEQVVEGGDPVKGEQYYQVCVACHGPQAKGNQSLNAPPLRGHSDWYLQSSLEKFKAGIRGGNPENANATLMRGMSNTLTDSQAVRDVVAYIMTLNSGAGSSGTASAK